MHLVVSAETVFVDKNTYTHTHLRIRILFYNRTNMSVCSFKHLFKHYNISNKVKIIL